MLVQDGLASARPNPWAAVFAGELFFWSYGCLLFALTTATATVTATATGPQPRLVATGGLTVTVTVSSGLYKLHRFGRRCCNPLFLQVTGRMCYSLYVWHPVVVQHNLQCYPELADWKAGLFTGLLLYALSALTYRYVEFPHKTLAQLFWFHTAQ